MATTVVLTKIDRGNSVKFKTNFFDESNNITNPNSASVTIAFPVAGSPDTYQTVVIAMTQAGNDWTAQWETIAVQPGRCYWRVYGPGATMKISDRGEFDLEVNPANLPQ
jgi:hypothetical protein